MSQRAACLRMLSVLLSAALSLATKNFWFDQPTEATQLKALTKTSDNPSHVVQNSLPAMDELIVTPAELADSDLQMELFVDIVTRLQLLLVCESASSTAEFALLSCS